MTVRYRADASLSRHEGGRVVLGGSPLTLFRLSDAGARALDAVLAGDGRTATEAPVARLVARLVDAGVLHPVPDPGPCSTTPRWRTADVALVVPARDAPAEALAALAAVAVADGVAEVVIVDDGSAPPVGHVTGATVVRRGVPGGPAAARNTGAGATAAPLIAFVDADVRLTPGWCAPLLAHLDDPAVALVAPRVRSAPGRGRIPRYERARSPLDLGPEPGRVRPGTRVSYLPAAAVVVRRADLVDVGGFDEALRTGEDVDLVWRLVEAGRRCRYEPAAVVEHEPRSSWAGWAAQRAGYGRSAGPLARRHPGALAPVAVSGWSAAVWAALVLLPRRAGPPAAAALAATTAVALHRRLRSGSLSLRLVGLGHLHAGRQLAAAVRRAWWPVLGVLALRSRRARRVLLLAAADALRDGGPIRIADDLAYGLGLWQGAWRERTAAPLLPDLTSWPRPSRYERHHGDGAHVRSVT